MAGSDDGQRTPRCAAVDTAALHDRVRVRRVGRAPGPAVPRCKYNVVPEVGERGNTVKEIGGRPVRGNVRFREGARGGCRIGGRSRLGPGRQRGSRDQRHPKEPCGGHPAHGAGFAGRLPLFEFQIHCPFRSPPLGQQCEHVRVMRFIPHATYNVLQP
ncbi:hypothetical protein D9M72_479900 [compost metagenome]